jgi:hypothetical protein
VDCRSPQRPGAQYPEGWRGFNEPASFYLREATHLAHFDAIPPATSDTDRANPALAAPFARIGKHGWPSGSLPPANALAFLLAVGATYLAGRRLGGEVHGVASALALDVSPTPLIGLVTIPWNTTASLAALMLVLLVAPRPPA